MQSRIYRFVMAVACSIVLLATTTVFAQDKDKDKEKTKNVGTIDATMFGTSTQMGKNVSIKLIIYRYSTAEERQTLIDAFKKGQTEGLSKALDKTKAVGRIQIPGTVGYDVGFIRLIPTATGRKIRFVADRPIKFGEAYRNTRSTAYTLTAGEINLDDQEKKKSDGVMYPAAQFVINKDGELQFELLQNPWRLGGIIDRTNPEAK